MFSAWDQSILGEKREKHDEGKAQRQTESVRSRQVEGGALCVRHESQSEIGKLMHDFLCSNAAEMYFDILKRQVSQFKNSEEGRHDMCEAVEEFAEKNRGAPRGARQARGQARGPARGGSRIGEEITRQRETHVERDRRMYRPVACAGQGAKGFNGVRKPTP